MSYKKTSPSSQLKEKWEKIQEKVNTEFQNKLPAIETLETIISNIKEIGIDISIEERQLSIEEVNETIGWTDRSNQEIIFSGEIKINNQENLFFLLKDEYGGDDHPLHLQDTSKIKGSDALKEFSKKRYFLGSEDDVSNLENTLLTFAATTEALKNKVEKSPVFDNVASEAKPLPKKVKATYPLSSKR